jgi:mannose-6-phosphate isomerase-like protein (cupin superfamily)
MDMSTRVGSIGLVLPKGITPAGCGKAGQPKEVVWSILGHTYWLKAECDGCFIFETLDPPGTFVPPHIHPTQDEFIYMLEGTFDLYLDGSWTQAKTGDLVRMPKGLPHAYITNRTSRRVHCSPSRLRDVYASCSINSIILLILMRWFAARRSARLISYRLAQCLGRDLMESLSANLPNSAQNVV